MSRSPMRPHPSDDRQARDLQMEAERASGRGVDLDLDHPQVDHDVDLDRDLDQSLDLDPDLDLDLERERQREREVLNLTFHPDFTRPASADILQSEDGVCFRFSLPVLAELSEWFRGVYERDFSRREARGLRGVGVGGGGASGTSSAHSRTHSRTHSRAHSRAHSRPQPQSHPSHPQSQSHSRQPSTPPPAPPPPRPHLTPPQPPVLLLPARSDALALLLSLVRDHLHPSKAVLVPYTALDAESLRGAMTLAHDLDLRVFGTRFFDVYAHDEEVDPADVFCVVAAARAMEKIQIAGWRAVSGSKRWKTSFHGTSDLHLPLGSVAIRYAPDDLVELNTLYMAVKRAWADVVLNLYTIVDERWFQRFDTGDLPRSEWDPPDPHPSKTCPLNARFKSSRALVRQIQVVLQHHIFDSKLRRDSLSDLFDSRDIVEVVRLFVNDCVDCAHGLPPVVAAAVLEIVKRRYDMEEYAVRPLPAIK